MIIVGSHTCTADHCVVVFLSLLSSSRVCFGLRMMWFAVWRVCVSAWYRYIVWPVGDVGGTFRIEIGRRDHSY